MLFVTHWQPCYRRRTGGPENGSGDSAPRVVDITMDIYTHALDDAKQKALEKFEARLVQ
jgi:hypothetical protein